jgi:hypothetical protein
MYNKPLLDLDCLHGYCANRGSAARVVDSGIHAVFFGFYGFGGRMPA